MRTECQGHVTNTVKSCESDVAYLIYCQFMHSISPIFLYFIY